MSSSDVEEIKFPALRVNQLDADEIDDELCGIVLNQYKKILDLLSVSDLSKFDAEANGLFRILFWWWSVKKHERTLGQEMMDMSYDNFGSSKSKLFHLCLTVIAPYLRERIPDGIRFLLSDSTCDYVERNFFKRIDIILEFLNVWHFLYFLNRGGFRSLTERILGLKAVHNNRPVIGEIDYTVINRELLWHGFADILIFVLPLLKFRRMWNFLKRRFFTRTKQRRYTNGAAADDEEDDDDNFASSMILSKEFVSKCAVCREYPIIPCHFGCGHAFCYYCLRANLDDDDKFMCPDCSCSAKNRKLKFVGAKLR